MPMLRLYVETIPLDSRTVVGRGLPINGKIHRPQNIVWITLTYPPFARRRFGATLPETAVSPVPCSQGHGANPLCWRRHNQRPAHGYGVTPRRRARSGHSRGGGSGLPGGIARAFFVRRAGRARVRRHSRKARGLRHGGRRRATPSSRNSGRRGNGQPPRAGRSNGMQPGSNSTLLGKGCA
jgi:hypothetical protein